MSRLLFVETAKSGKVYPCACQSRARAKTVNA
jgi:hypothetical protein